MYIWRKHATTDWLRRLNENLLGRFGSTFALIERPETNRVLLEVACRTAKESQQLIREFGGSSERLRAGWLSDFAKQAQGKPLRLGSRLVVQSTPESKRKQSRSRACTIVILAEAAFGTGEHATTAMCLRLLERFSRKRRNGWAMLDAGSGTGILAIAGSCLGAGRILAIDNDPIACAIAKRNARANGVCNIEFKIGDVLKLRLGGTFDIITANLFSEILISALPRWSRHLARGGCLILSGLFRSEETAMVSALQRNGFAAQEIRRRGKWIALLAVRGRRSAPSLPRKRP